MNGTVSGLTGDEHDNANSAEEASAKAKAEAEAAVKTTFRDQVEETQTRRWTLREPEAEMESKRWTLREPEAEMGSEVEEEFTPSEVASMPPPFYLPPFSQQDATKPPKGEAILGPSCEPLITRREETFSIQQPCIVTPPRGWRCLQCFRLQWLAVPP